MPALLGDVRSGLAVVCDEGAIDMCSQQEVDHGIVSPAGRTVQRGESSLLARVGVSSSLKEKRRGGPVADRHRRVERRDQLRVASVRTDIGAARDQLLGKVRMAEEDGQAKRRKPVASERVQQGWIRIEKVHCGRCIAQRTRFAEVCRRLAVQEQRSEAGVTGVAGIQNCRDAPGRGAGLPSRSA